MEKWIICSLVLIRYHDSYVLCVPRKFLWNFKQSFYFKGWIKSLPFWLIFSGQNKYSFWTYHFMQKIWTLCSVGAESVSWHYSRKLSSKSFQQRNWFKTLQNCLLSNILLKARVNFKIKSKLIYKDLFDFLLKNFIIIKSEFIICKVLFFSFSRKENKKQLWIAIKCGIR